jgi:formylglycine-generating enzyme required for sulfatase activity
MQTLHLQPQDAVRAVTWLGAMMYAESVGKRLPWEDEYELAATNGGNSLYPWGQEWRFESWSFPRAGTPVEDATQDEPRIYGLYSNVGEWTMSYSHPYVGGATESASHFAGKRVVRGAPLPVVQGQRLDKSGLVAFKTLLDPRQGTAQSPLSRLQGVGFRCARSAKARFLEP